MNFRRIISQFDFTLMLIITIIFSLGVTTIASATNAVSLGGSREFKMQLISFVLGIIVILVFQFIDYEVVGQFHKPLYVIGILLLLLVYVPGLGVERFGSRSWIALGPIDLQTSELAKITYIIFFAKFLENMDGVKGIKDIIKCALVFLPYFGIVFKQPDLGSSLVFVSATFGMMFVAGLKYRYILLGSIVFAGSMPFVYPRLDDHQRIRIDAYLNPEDLSLPGNYQVYQSKVTMGSGQMYGKGFFEGVYHRLNYLPVQESDFIFPVFVEETGFVGGLVLIVLYFLFLWKLIVISMRVKDEFGSYIIVGFSFMFAFQIFENIAMTMGQMPVTGITLPFFSYGSTSLVSSLMAVGIIQSIYIRRKKTRFTV